MKTGTTVSCCRNTGNNRLQQFPSSSQMSLFMSTVYLLLHSWLSEINTIFSYATLLRFLCYLIFPSLRRCSSFGISNISRSLHQLNRISRKNTLRSKLHRCPNICKNKICPETLSFSLESTPSPCCGRRSLFLRL